MMKVTAFINIYRFAAVFEGLWEPAIRTVSCYYKM